MNLAQRLLALPKPLLLAFDVDGTLAPIVDDPSRAEVPRQVLAALASLAAAPDLHLAFLTGRDAPALTRMVPLTHVWRAVDHGASLLKPGDLEPAPPSKQEQDSLDAFARFVSTSGARLESKSRSVAAHVRGIEDGSRLLRLCLEEAVRLGLRVRAGRAVVEASFLAGDKGAALEAIAKHVQAESVFFAGDDRTDLPAVRFAIDHGIGGFVMGDGSPTPPPSSVILDGPEAVAALVLDVSRIVCG